MGGYDYLFKRKAGGSTYCYGEIVDGANFEVICDDESFDGIAADVEVAIFSVFFLGVLVRGLSIKRL